MTIRNYINLTGTGAFIALVLCLYVEIADKIQSPLRYVFFGLFIAFSILSLIDALKGGLNDPEIIGKPKKAQLKE